MSNIWKEKYSKSSLKIKKTLIPNLVPRMIFCRFKPFYTDRVNTKIEHLPVDMAMLQDK
jgi:hypothetical protein